MRLRIAMLPVLCAALLPDAGRASGDVVLDAQALGRACLAVAAGSDVQLKWKLWYEPDFACGAAPVTPEDACRRLTGNAGWYVGEAEPPPSPTGVSKPNVTCRGSGPRQFIALAHIARYCQARGYATGNTGISSGRQAVCAHQRQPPAITLQPADICREQHGTSAVEVRGLLHWCPP
jgi:hypothetical protein